MFRLAVDAIPLDNSRTGSKPLTSILFNVNEESVGSGVSGAASVTVRIGTLVVHNGVDCLGPLLQTEGFECVSRVTLVDGDNVVGTNPRFGFLSRNKGEIPGPGATVVNDAFVRIRV